MTTGAMVNLLTALFKALRSEVIKELYAVAWLVKAVDTLVALVAAMFVNAVFELLPMLNRAVFALPATPVIAELALEAIDA
jgi:hypothetical protein